MPAFTSSTSHRTNPLKGGECSVRFSTVAPEDLRKGAQAGTVSTLINKSVKVLKKTRTANKGKRSSKGRSKQGGQIKQKTQKVFKPLKDLELGSTISGRVVEICEFGAFVDIGYASRGSRPGTALLHKSQIQDGKIDKVDDVLKKGDIVEGARVIKIDYIKGEVGISLRQRRQKRKDVSEFKVRDKLVGRIDTVLPYGAFVDVGANVNPLLHISRITGSAIDNIRHYVNEGDSVPVHVIDIDVEKKTMAVSMLDKKADQYLDRRLSQKKRKFFGTAKEDVEEITEDIDDESELDYFDKAIQELEAALKGK